MSRGRASTNQTIFAGEGEPFNVILIYLINIYILLLLIVNKWLVECNVVISHFGLFLTLIYAI